VVVVEVDGGGSDGVGEVVVMGVGEVMGGGGGGGVVMG